jgi:radical SAM superfamily enzyme YgiQ (UPF0313 family)
MSNLLLFVRPPRPIWPFNGPGSAFWPPLAFASLAAAVREQVHDVEVAILDAPALRMGWRTIEQHIRSLNPAYVAIGEEAVSCADGLRLAALAKSMGTRVIAGGCCFGNLAAEVLGTGLVDFVVHGEGEQTLVELIRVLQSRDHDLSVLSEIRGVSFRDCDTVVTTPWRDPIDDLDRLPFPAYDLLPMHRYGVESRNHRDFVALELSRGCSHRCSFCVLWRQMGRFVAFPRAARPSPLGAPGAARPPLAPTPSSSAHLEACLRTKSPGRVVAEIEYVAQRFGRKYIGWVDPCFNANPTVPRQVAETLLSRGMKLGQSAWVRADYLCRDASSGALDSLVRSGLNEVYIGIERCSNADLGALAKGSQYDDVRCALRQISTRYPQVCTVGSFIYGIEGESRQSIRELFRGAYELPLDIVMFIPLTPLPGTPFWDRDLWDGTGDSLRQCSFLPLRPGTPGSSSLFRTTKLRSFQTEVHRAMLRNVIWYWPPMRLRNCMRSFAAPDPRRRSIVRRFIARGFRFILGPRDRSSMPLPAWYEN